MHNELLNIMGAQVLREKLANIRDRKFFSIMADEGTYISNLEQLFFCARTVDDDLNDDKDFLGFYEIVNIKSETVARATKDILMRCSLRLDDCRGQTYDGASNMMGKHSGVSTKISEEQTKATATHCQDHSLSLAVKSLTKECPILRDTMGTVGEIYVLVKYSSKREKMLGKLTENVEGTFDRDEQQATKLDKLCVSRCTVRANCLKKIIGNCKPLLKLWKKSLEEKLDADMKSRIIGCKKQMESFKFYFGLQLDRKLYAHTDSLSKTLQQEKMSTMGSHWQISPHKFWKAYVMIVTTTFSTKVSKNQLAKSRLSQNRPYRENKTRQISVSFNLSRTAQSYFKAIYNEAIDTIINSIRDNFEQPGFKVFNQVEQLFLKSVNKEDH